MIKYKKGDRVKYIGLYTPECEEYGIAYEDEFIIYKPWSVGWKNTYIVQGCKMFFKEEDLELIKRSV